MADNESEIIIQQTNSKYPERNRTMADVFIEGNKACPPRQDLEKSEDDISKTQGKSIRVLGCLGHMMKNKGRPCVDASED